LAKSLEYCVLKYDPHMVSIVNMKMNVITTNNTVGFKNAVWIFFMKSLVSLCESEQPFFLRLKRPRVHSHTWGSGDVNLLSTHLL
jgi:hypothetical protein